MESNENRFRKGLPENASAEDKNLFAIYCLENYERKTWKNDTLSEYFAEDFEKYSVEDFRNLDTDIRRRLRDHLRDKGVYVRKGRNVQMSIALFEAVHEDLAWPEDEQHNIHNSNNSRNVNNLNQIDAQGQIRNSISNEGSRTNRTQVFRSSYLGTLFKAYNNASDCYSGNTEDNFDRKFLLFLERCDQSGIPISERHRAFSIMLSSNARQYYFDHLQNKGLNLEELSSATKERFHTEERIRTLLREWESITLGSIKKKYTGKSSTACLEILLTRIQDIQLSLPKEYRNDVLLKNKILNAVKDVEECKLAYYKPADSINGVIADLHSALATASAAKTTTVTTTTPPIHTSRPTTEAYYVDRRYHNKRNNKKYCLVCKKKGCWSTNHTKEERLKALQSNGTFKKLSAYFKEESSESSHDDDDIVLDELEQLSAQVSNDAANAPQSTHLTPPQIEDEDNLSSFIAHLRESSAIHALTSDVYKPRRYSEEHFYGIMVDSGCAKGSTGGREQYHAYCRHIGTQPSVQKSKSTRVTFGKGSAQSFGTAIISFPFNNTTLSFTIHIIDGDIPLLLSLYDMDRLGLYYNNTSDQLIHSETGQSVRVDRCHGHAFLTWNPITECMFTYNDLKRLHRRFGHPTVEKLMNLLRRADVDRVGDDTRKALTEITRSCDPCQRYAQPPRRFKFTLRDEKFFNQSLYVDIFTLDKKPVLHIVDESTKYQAARWLPDVSTEQVWRALRLAWIDTYLGPPSLITYDAGKQFISKAFQSQSDLLHIDTRQVPVESPNSLTYVERYHEPIRKAYKCVKQEAPDLDSEAALQMAVKAVNDSTGPNGLVPTLLVYGALPRLGLPNDAPTPSTFKRAVALKHATNEVTKYFAKRQVKDALRTRNGPDTSDVHKAPIGSHVLVYRPKKDRWEGPYALLGIDGETCSVLLPTGPTPFRSTVVKRHVTSRIPQDQLPPSLHHQTPCSENEPNNSHVPQPFISSCFIQDNKEQAEIFDVMNASLIPQSELNTRFEHSRHKEMKGLIEKNVFKLVNEKEAKGHRIYGSRFVDEVKHEGTPDAYEKSRLVVQAFNDTSHGLLTYAPTVQRASQRLLLAICALDSKLKLFTRDVSQAYTQSSTPINRKIYVRPPAVLRYPSNILLHIIKPLYGIPEAGTHWFLTYMSHHTKKLGMKPSTYDQCLLTFPGTMDTSSKNKSRPRGLTCIQTDDTMNAGNDTFVALEKNSSARFITKPAQHLSDSSPIRFNGAIISSKKDTYYMTQQDNIRKLKTLDENAPNKTEFISQRARGSYISSVCRPDLTFAFSIASQVTTPTTQDAKTLNRAISACISTPNFGLKFVPLDPATIVMAVFADASFATNKDSTSQLGYLITLMDEHGKTNIIHYGSIKAKRVARSVLAAELFSMVHAFDISTTMRLTLNMVFNRLVPLKLYTDSKSLYDSLVRINSTTEKRLLVDLHMLRQSYERREISDVYWIPTGQNPADALTKEKPSLALHKLMSSNQLTLTPNAWVHRSKPSWA